MLGLKWGRDDRVLRERLGIQLQETQFSDKLSVEEIVRLFRSFYKRGRTVDEVIALVELESKRTAWFSKLSGGQKQRLALACALVSEPDLLFLDEPTTGLDPQSRRQLWELLERFKASGGTSLLTTHYMDEAEILCDRVAIVDKGKVIALGTPRELIRSLGAEHVVEFAMSDGHPGPSEAALRALPGVQDVRREGDAWKLIATRDPSRRAGAARRARRLAFGARAALDAQRDARRRLRLVDREAPARCMTPARTATRSSSNEQRVSSPLVELTIARLKEFLREPEAVFWVFAFPVLMALALGVAFRTHEARRCERGRAEAGERVRTAASADAIAKTLTDAGGIRVRVLSPPEAEVALRNGVVAVLIVPAPRALTRTPALELSRRRRIATIANRPESHLARLTIDAALQRAAGRQDVWKANDQQVVTPGSRYIDWLLPGLLGMNIMGTGLWSIGFSVVMARTRKLLKRLMATPMPRGYYLLSHLLARLGFLVLEVVVLLFFGWLVFGVTSQGSFLLLAGLCLLGAFSFAGLGLLIASRARTIEAVSGLMNVAMLPMWLLSGVFFSSANFPDVAQPFIQALPLTALIDALRGVMIEGQSFAGIAHEIGILSAWGAGTFLLALKLFRWR